MSATGQRGRTRHSGADKIAGTIERDRTKDAALEAAGWLVVIVWEHEDVADAARRIADAVASRRPTRNRAFPNGV